MEVYVNIFKQPDYPTLELWFNCNGKIGALDLETLSVDKFENQAVYTGGWSAKKSSNYIYGKDVSLPGEGPKIDSYGVVTDLIYSIFSAVVEQGHKLSAGHKDTTDLADLTFYVHNLGRFDLTFILKALALYDVCRIDPWWKEETI